MQSIGVCGGSIEISYIFQALFYAIVGTFLGLVLVLGFLVPYIGANPINFPFSDGFLSIPFWGTFIRILVLFLMTITAGFIPAKLIASKNALEAILEK